MNLTDKQKNKLLALAQIVDKGDAAVLEKLFELQDTIEKLNIDDKSSVISDLIEELKTTIENTKGDIQNNKANSEAAISKMFSVLDTIKTEITDSVEKTNKSHSDMIKGLSQKISDEIADIKETLPTMPDLSLIDSRITEVENKIPEIPEEMEGEEIVEKINSLDITPDKQIDVEHIKGLTDKIKELEARVSAPRSGGGFRANNEMKFYDLSSQTNGSLTVFTVPKSKAAVVLGSDFPSVLMEGNGFTLNGTRTQLTLTVTNAPSSGSQLLFQYTSIFNTL